MASSGRGVPGFTLIEISVGTILVLTIGATLIVLLSSSSNLTRTLDTAATSQAEARRALMAMEAELSQTGFVDALGALRITSALPGSSITFELPMDVDGDGYITDVNAALEWNAAAPVTYALDTSVPGSTRLVRTQPGQPTRILANHVQSIAFGGVTYPNTPGPNSLADDLVSIEIVVRGDVPFGPSSTFTLRSTIRPRHTSR